MKVFVIIALCLFSVSASAQRKVSSAEAYKYVGDTITVCGKVFGGRYLDYANKQPTLINMGGKFPDQEITIYISGENRRKFGYKPEEMLSDKQVCATGRIELYNNKPQLVVTEPFHIKIIQ